MGLIVQIQGLYTPENDPIHCKGVIDILRQEQKVVYASWQIRDENGVQIGSVSRNYFVDKEKVSDIDAIELILNDIRNYSIGRKKVFSEIQVLI
jgi:hypothetical protein